MGSRLSRQSSLESSSSSSEAACSSSPPAAAAPYVRRVSWLREIQATIRERKREQASRVLLLLRKVPAKPTVARRLPPLPASPPAPASRCGGPTAPHPASGGALLPLGAANKTAEPGAWTPLAQHGGGGESGSSPGPPPPHEVQLHFLE